MSAPLRHPLQSAALDFSEAMRDVINANAGWYSQAENAAEAEFGQAITALLELADDTANRGYLQPDTAAVLGNTWLEKLNAAAGKTKALISPNTKENQRIFQQFYQIIDDTSAQLVAIMKTLDPAETAGEQANSKCWLLRFDDYKKGPIELRKLVPASKTKLPDEDQTLIDGISEGDRMVVFAVAPKFKVFGLGRFELNPTDASKFATVDQAFGAADDSVLRQYLDSAVSANFYKQLNGKDRVLFPLPLPVFDGLQAALSTKKNDYKRLHNYLLSDQYADLEKDALGFKTYADTISGLLAEGTTRPPLNIAIIAPWGRGKTTLMRMVKNNFDHLRAAPTQASADGAARLRDLRRWFKAYTRNASFTTSAKVEHATVWFNPWNYQSSEMIWAGLAHAIINQVVDQLPTQKDKEAFWFKLKLARVDKQKIRHELHIGLIHLGMCLAGLAVAGLAAALALTQWDQLSHTGLAIFGIGGLAAGAFNGVMSYLKPKRSTVATAFTNLTQPPNYDQKLGLFHEVNADVKTVLELLADKQKPPVVFVDDLDRCSPAKVVEVIEAINLFMSGEFNTRCYFVIGMDAEIVAAALDVAYEKMKGQIRRNESEQGSIGWYFLDKFIQLPFFIPVLDKEKKEQYLRGILGSEAAAAPEGLAESAEADPNDVDGLATALQNCDTDEARQTLLAQKPKVLVAKYTSSVVRAQIIQKQDDPEIKQQVAVYADFLGGDPRSLKRFANLLRFYGSHQYLRMTLGQPHVQISTLARWLAVMIRFPKMIRWIQWEDDSSLTSQLSPQRKAAAIDGLAAKLPADATAEVAYRQWLTQTLDFAQHKDHPAGLPLSAVHDGHWLKSKLFVELLLLNPNEEANFTNALTCNVL
jgi:hypothetical protein